MWEALYSFGVDALPHIPDRFFEGYGLNADSVQKLQNSKTPKLKLIITVDNGIMAYEGIKKAKELGIDVIVVDHHTKGLKKLATSYVLHSAAVCGSALAYFFAKELGYKDGLELAAIGTIADQMPLIGMNRSLVKYGLSALNETTRLGLLALFREAGIEEVGTYEVNYMIAPRINAMGRISHGLDSLRLLCTKNTGKARELSFLLSKTNAERQKIVDDVLIKAKSLYRNNSNKLLVISHSSFHEGVIGLAAGKLTEEFYRPAIVLSKKGDVSKASARSISGFNIIEAIRETDLILEGGGHPMAAGFSIETSKIEIFSQKINAIAEKLLTDELLERKLKVDMELDFEQISFSLLSQLKQFEPFGLGNPTPTFMTADVEVLETRTVGQNAKHLKLKLKQDEQIFDTIYFGGGEFYSKLPLGIKIDVAYQIDENIWNGRKCLQLKVKDIKKD